MEQISQIEIISLLQNTELFHSLHDDDLEKLAKYCEFQSFDITEIIFSEKQKAKHLYIVQNGEVMIIADTQDKESIDVARYINGECFGELDFFDKSNRSATALTRTKTNLLLFPKTDMTFEDLQSNDPELSAKLLHVLLAEVAGRIRKTNKLISEKTPWITDLKRQMNTDKLTGLYNKRFLDEDFIDQFYSFGDNISLIMIKPYNFKNINDKYGHTTGDKALRMLAVFISSILKENYIPIRYKGDEFTIILPNTDLTGVKHFTESLFSIIKEMDLRHITNEEIHHLTISVGFASFPEQVSTAQLLIETAYNNLLIAHKNGGNTVYG